MLSRLKHISTAATGFHAVAHQLPVLIEDFLVMFARSRLQSAPITRLVNNFAIARKAQVVLAWEIELYRLAAGQVGRVL